MIRKEVEVLNRSGIHARPATLIVDTANKFKSELFIEKDGNKVNARSIMIILTLGATYKSKMAIIAEGEDEEEAVSALVNLFESRFEIE